MAILPLILFFSLSFTSLQAATFKRISSIIEMTESCANMPARQEELKNWTQQADQRSCTLNAPRKGANGICIVDITSCLPDHVQKYQGRNSDVYGPNCWNLALVMAGLTPGLRASNPNEWDLYIKSPMCRALSESEAPQAGDLGSLEERVPGSQPVHHHGFIYVSPELVYSKNGQGERIPYALQPFKVMAKANNVDGYGGVCDGEGCPKGRIFYYRCESFNEYFSKMSSPHKEGLKKISDQIKDVECLYQSSLFDGKDSSVLPALLSSSVEALAVYLKEASKDWEGSTPDERRLLNSFSMRLSSIQDSLGTSAGEVELRKIFGNARMQLPRK